MSSSNLAAPIIVPEERASVQSVGMARALVRLTSKRDESLTDIDVEAIFGEWSLLNAASFSEYTRANFEKAATLTRALNPTHQLPRRRARHAFLLGSTHAKQAQSHRTTDTANNELFRVERSCRGAAGASARRQGDHDPGARMDAAVHRGPLSEGGRRAGGCV
jgi:hypothetical protein